MLAMIADRMMTAAAARTRARLGLAAMTRRSSAARERAAALPIWTGPVEPEPLAGGITNLNFVVARRRPALSRAHRRRHPRAQGPAPLRARRQRAPPTPPASRRRCATPRPGALVLDFIDGRTLTAEDVRDPANLDRLAALVRALPPRDPAALPRPGADLLGLPGPARLRPHPARGGSRYRATCPRLLAAAERLEAAVGPVEIVFGHNDLLPANLIDDGDRLWLVDWDYAGFNIAALRPRRPRLQRRHDRGRARGAARRLLRPPARRGAPPPRRGDDRRLAAARDDVEHGLRAPLGDRLRLRRLHRREPRAASRRPGPPSGRADA